MLIDLGLFLERTIEDTIERPLILENSMTLIHDVTLPNGQRFSVNIPSLNYFIMGPQPIVGSEPLTLSPGIQFTYKNGQIFTVTSDDKKYLKELYEMVLESLTGFTESELEKKW